MDITSLYEHILRKKIKEVEEVDLSGDIAPAFIKANVAIEMGIELVKVMEEFNKTGNEEIFSYKLEMITKFLHNKEEESNDFE